MVKRSTRLPLVAVTSHGCTGSQTGSGIGSCWMRTPESPICLNLPSSHWADSASADEPIGRPQ